MKIKLDKVPKSCEEFVNKKLPDKILGIELVKPRRKAKRLWVPIVLGSAVALAYSISRVGSKTKQEIENIENLNENN